MSGRPELRIGDREREIAASALGDHFAEGRITREEYDERSAVVWSARTESDLRTVFADLPGPHQGFPRRPRPAPDAAADRRSHGSGHFRFPLLPVILVIVGVAMLADAWPVLLLLGLVWWVFVSRVVRHAKRVCGARPSSTAWH